MPTPSQWIAKRFSWLQDLRVGGAGNDILMGGDGVDSLLGGTDLCATRSYIAINYTLKA